MGTYVCTHTNPTAAITKLIGGRYLLKKAGRPKLRNTAESS